MTEEIRAILFSYRFDGTGSAAPVDPMKEPEAGAVTWVHLNGRSPDARKYLRDVMRLDTLVIKSLLAEETRPRLDEFGENVLIILRGVHYNAGPEPEDLVSTRVWVGNNRIVTLGRRKSRAIADINDKIQANRAPRRAGEFIALLIGSLHDGIEPAIQELDVMADTLEEESLEHPRAELRNDIATARKQATLLRRHMSPQRDVINRLQTYHADWMHDSDRWYIKDNYDRVSRYVEDLDAIRERTQIVQDELASALSSRLNQNIYILSMITVIFMPLTFLTGLLGINVEGIPGAHSPAAFLAFCAILALITVGEIILFKKLKWL